MPWAIDLERSLGTIDTNIQQHRAESRKDDFGRIHRAMHDVPLMQVLQRISDRFCKIEYALPR